ncbi:DgyrCDS6630 [Dimorphilus gyrociliatus]|uniref:DgyrCDS6630 n=1 Tax=Dimorphilus gyrociliatus TaxID=2664684 RepID=A0A7I8VQW6_9ANNE|nr:DgyrCDS6630 [Dimorphilus gyrociliatus]
MYKREKSLNIKGSASAVCNNLSVNVQPDKDRITYAVVHKSVVNITTSSVDGRNIAARQVVCKEQSSTASCIIIQAKIVTVAGRQILVVTSQKGIHMYELEGLLPIYAHTLPEPEPACTCTLAKGIAVLLNNVITIGTYEGHVMVLSIPGKGNNIQLVETLRNHSFPISALDGIGDILAVVDERGQISTWRAGQPFEKLLVGTVGINPSDCVTSLVLCPNDLIACSTTSGCIRFLSFQTCCTLAHIDAHARCITSLSIAPSSGLILSTSEDSTVRVWKVARSKSDLDIKLEFSEHIKDAQLQGGAFLSPNGYAFAASYYDSSELVFFTFK